MSEFSESEKSAEIAENQTDLFERSLSSDDTDFLDLPLPPVPLEMCNEIHNLDSVNNISNTSLPTDEIFMYTRMNVFDNVSIDSLEEIRSSCSTEDKTIDDNCRILSLSSGDESSSYREKSPVLKSQPSSPEIMSNLNINNNNCCGKSYLDYCDDSTCCDEDFTWVRSTENHTKEKHHKSSHPSTPTNIINKNSHQEQPSETKQQNQSQQQNIGKPPRPSGSLDRRIRNNVINRQERDGKSRSTHSLKEKSISDFNKDTNNKASPKLENGNNFHHDPNYHLHRGSPKFWDLPPPPSVPYTPWDQYWNFQRSREELRMLDYHRRQHEAYRYGSNGTLSNSQCDLYGSGMAIGGGGPMGCCPRYPPYYCMCDHRNIMGSNRELGNAVVENGTGVRNIQRQDTDERLRRLQTDKESLALQVQVLSEQVSAQHERINELENKLTEKTQLMNNIEDLLHRVSEFATTVSFEIDKQKEMLSRSSLETQKLELLSAMSDLKLKQAALERENLELRTSNLNNNNNSLSSRRPPLGPMRMLTSSPHTPSLNTTPNQTHHGSYGSLPQNSTNSLTPKTPPSSSRRQVDLHYNSLPRQAFPTNVSTLSSPSPSSTGSSSAAIQNSNQHLLQQQQTTPQSINNSIDTNANPASSKQRNVVFGKTFFERPNLTTTATTLPTIITTQSQAQPSILLSSTPPRLNFYQLNGFQKQRGFSVPNLADTEKVIEDTTDMPRSYTPQPSQSPLMGTKSKGLRGIFGKLKRSNSGNLEDLPMDGEFKRGGIRSTAGPRLGWSQSQQKLVDKPFCDWDVEAICYWLEELGLEAYTNDARRWLKNGAKELITASPVDIEKELNLKSPLHRKKLVLAIADMTSNDNSDELFKNAGKLDTNWIMKWLEDVGLPQYKDAFQTARLDGRMLHKLTMDDLGSLHITSMLHVASFRRGIQVMRENLWDPNCLIRRSSGDDNEKVIVWTAHRVMEWLEAIDLAEYTPNLRGAGVHGGLMVYEPKFTSELLAEMLSIPPNKTLLRRHLALHFSELIGRDIIQAKRDAENTLGYVPLTITSKIKTPKKSQFSLKRKKSNKNGTEEWSDYVCPMGPSGDHLTTSNPNTTTVSTMNPTAEHGVVSGVVSPQLTNNDSPTSTRSSNSTS